MGTRGFTLIELTLVAALMSSLVATEVERWALQAREERRQLFVRQVEDIRVAARRYHRDRSLLSTDNKFWPDSMADLRLAPHNNRNYLPTLSDNRSAFGGQFSLKAQDDESPPLIHIDVGSSAEANILVHRLAGPDNQVQDSLIQAPLLLPGDFDDSYYLRSGALPLLGDMNANRNALRNVFELETQDLVVQGTQSILSDPDTKRQMRRISTKGHALATIHPFRYLKNDREELGFSAAQVEALWPQLVRHYPAAGTGTRRYLSYDGLLAVLWAEVQRLASRLDHSTPPDPRE